jgi:hypothetical protein
LYYTLPLRGAGLKQQGARADFTSGELFAAWEEFVQCGAVPITKSQVEKNE